MGENNIVATCHANDCVWWESEHCIAPKIQVSMMNEHADCDTYEIEGGAL